MSDLQDRLEAELFRQVPSAFWLDPNRWGDAPKPPPPPPPPPLASRPLPAWLRCATWEGIPITAADYAAHDMTWRLRLEDGRNVVLTQEMLRAHSRWSLM